jgi:asparagine synthase (glutamine-hydrolysing)
LCGIAGFTHENWFPGPDRIQRVTATLIHRGPDQQGVFRSAVCSLGATRLKILDLDGGDQPIATDDGNTVIVFNGEIYNHLELRNELEQRGHRFRSRTDTETVLRAFLEWDTRCFARLRGMFAVALWQKPEKRLVLARDRMGIKPLYLARHGDDLLFGSELKAILEHPEIDRRLSPEGLDCYLSLNYVPCPWTLVDGIEKLPPAHWLEWRDGRIATEAYWTLPTGEPRERTLGEAREELDALLRQSVREHLLAEVPLGVWLSGGIDSSTILHYAAKASPARLNTFSISFSGRSFDESAYIGQAVAQYGTDHHQLDLAPSSGLADTIQAFAHFSDEPSADAGALPVWYLSKLTKAHATVALSGEGADELFGGYLTYRANGIARQVRRAPAAAIRAARAALGCWPVSDERISFEYKAKRFLDGCLMPPERAHVHWNGTFSDAEKAAIVRPALPHALAGILRPLGQRLRDGDTLPLYLWFDQAYFLPDDILTKVDRMSMAHSVEVRPPFLDHRLVEFAAALPPRFKIHGSRQKVLLKELMAGVLPPAILHRKKVGFDIPAHEWLRGPLRSLLLDTVRDTGRAAIFNDEAIGAYVDSHLERRVNVGYHLWGLMILLLWMDKWRIQAPSSARRSAWTPEPAAISS